MRLEVDHYDAINKQIRTNREVIEEGQLALMLSSDMRAFKNARVELAGDIHPAIDVDQSCIPEGAGRWISVTDPSRERIIGLTAARFFENESVEHLLHARLIWGDKLHPIDEFDPKFSFKTPWKWYCILTEFAFTIYFSLLTI